MNTLSVIKLLPVSREVLFGQTNQVHPDDPRIEVPEGTILRSGEDFDKAYEDSLKDAVVGNRSPIYTGKSGGGDVQFTDRYIERVYGAGGDMLDQEEKAKEATKGAGDIINPVCKRFMNWCKKVKLRKSRLLSNLGAERRNIATRFSVHI